MHSRHRSLLSFLAVLITSGMLALWAAPGAVSGSATSGVAIGESSGTIELGRTAQGLSREPTYGTLGGHRRVVVRDLPAASASVIEDSKARLIPRRTAEIGIRATGSGDGASPEANAVDRAAQPALLGGVPPTTATSFDGVDNAVNVSVTRFNVSPPDPQIAVGPNHVVEFVNIVGRITNKSGVVAVPDFALRDFFPLPPSTLDTDPKIIYDAIAGRFFATYIDFDASDGHLYLAISETSDPTGAWNTYFLSCPGCIPDYEGIAVTNDKFTISTNLFPIAPGSFIGEQTLVVQKSDVMAGDPAPDITIFPIAETRFTVRPAQNLSPADDQYLTTWDSFVLNEITVIKITGTPEAGNVIEASVTNLTTLVQDTPPPSLTAGTEKCFVSGVNFGTPPCIDSGDFRLLEAVWRNKSLWSSSSSTCVPPGDGTVRSCAHLVEVETAGTPSVVQDIMFGAIGEYYSWPAIRTDASGNLYVSMTHTNSMIFAEARVAGRLATDPLGTMSGSKLLRAGDVVHVSGRWGDYLGAAVDPVFPQCVWVVGQYAKSTSGAAWGTYIGSLSYTTNGCSAVATDTDGDGCTDQEELAVSPTLGGQREPTNFWDFYDVPAGAPPLRDQMVNIIDIAAVVLRFGTVSDPPLTKQAALLEAVMAPPDMSSYHAAFDRGGPIVGQDLWDLLGPNGSINIIDIGAAVIQFGHTCSDPP